MSGCLQVLLAGKVLPVTLSTATTETMTSGSRSITAPPDTRQYGFLSGVIGSFPSGTPSFASTGGDTYSLQWAKEDLAFSTSDGSYGGAFTRTVGFYVSGGTRPLTQSAFTSLTTPSGAVLNTASASFTPSGSGGIWTWTVTTGTDDGSADYCGNGTFTVTQ